MFILKLETCDVFMQNTITQGYCSVWAVFSVNGAYLSLLFRDVTL